MTKRGVPNLPIIDVLLSVFNVLPYHTMSDGSGLCIDGNSQRHSPGQR